MELPLVDPIPEVPTATEARSRIKRSFFYAGHRPTAYKWGVQCRACLSWRAWKDCQNLTEPCEVPEPGTTNPPRFRLRKKSTRDAMFCRPPERLPKAQRVPKVRLRVKTTAAAVEEQAKVSWKRAAQLKRAHRRAVARATAEI